MNTNNIKMGAFGEATCLAQEKEMYLVPCRAQNEKLAKFDGGSMLSANATLVFKNRNQRSDNTRIIERT
jgi:hypothetical protein